MEKQPSSTKNDEPFDVLKDKIRKRLLKYTIRAFRMLPRMDKPRILDIGCGSGIPTLELARLGRGEVIGIDIDQPALDIFTSRIKQAGLSDRVRAINCSMFDMDFPDESFDIIWCEGSIYPIGFQKGLREWKRFLKPGGHLVIHDEQGNISEKLRLVSDCGYELIGHFLLSQDTWRREYFTPLEELVNGFQTKLTDDLGPSEEMHQARKELDMFRNNPERNSSVYFVMISQP